MADIDKALPNVETEIKVPGEEEIAVAEQQTVEEQVGPDDIQVTQEEDGGATINFDPEAVNAGGGESHFDNLADLLPEEVLGRLGSELFENYTQYKASRKDWEDAYTKGLDLLGFKYDNRTQPFQGASGAPHPVVAEADASAASPEPTVRRHARPAERSRLGQPKCHLAHATRPNGCA